MVYIICFKSMSFNALIIDCVSSSTSSLVFAQYTRLIIFLYLSLSGK